MVERIIYVRIIRRENICESILKVNIAISVMQTKKYLR